MSSSPHPIKVLRCFVDETGDGAIFNRHGDVIIGTDGCSKYFILGFVSAEETNHIEKELDSLRSELCSDPYFKKVPSMQASANKTAMLFHAKDEIPEARWKVYRFIEKLDIKFSAVIINKEDTLAAVRTRNLEDKNYRYKESESYELMTRELFKPFLLNKDYPNHWLDILFAFRGNREKTKALEKALYDEREKIFNTVETHLAFGDELLKDIRKRMADIDNKLQLIQPEDCATGNMNVTIILDDLEGEQKEVSRNLKHHKIIMDQVKHMLRLNEMQREHVRSGKLIQLNGTYPSQNPMLQVVDYCLWALQRYYERGEERYIEYIWGKVDRIEEIRPGENRVYTNNDYVWGNKK
ncbi:MAG: DUF3800 domain-containing protein [Nitrospinae bacterium]|nr:DUF3800 domain-containing protein [Nitrospinota bacterium]MBF0633476.1 DUF3800 domain-containing protein [Nitrospinota bacterium]